MKLFALYLFLGFLFFFPVSFGGGTQCSMQDLSSLTRYQICALCTGRVEA